MQQSLLLVSSSKGRHRLLKEAGIPFTVIEHASDENVDATGLSPEQLVCQVARGKLSSISLPLEQFNGQELFVLAADTLVFTADGGCFAKPQDKAEAIKMLEKFRTQPIVATTGCCLQVFKQDAANIWQLETQRTFTVSAEIMYAVPPQHTERYFALTPDFLSASGGARVEEAGAQFVAWINGSYTTIQGLPMFQLREHLDELGFKF